MRLDDPEADQTRANLRKPRQNEDGTWRYILSDESMDSYSTIIRVKGWSLKRFLTNPIVPWAHRYDIPPVGQALRVWKSAETGQPQLLMDVKFMKPEDYADDWPAGIPSPVAIEAMVAAGYLRGASVGMRPLEWEFLRKLGADGKEDPRGEVLGIEYRKQELLEGSIVPIPSNANALARCLTEGHLKISHLPGVLDLVNSVQHVDPEMVAELRREIDSPRLFAIKSPEPSAELSGVVDLAREVGGVARQAAGLQAPPADLRDLAKSLGELRTRLLQALTGRENPHE
jgi:hypothetical protein